MTRRAENKMGTMPIKKLIITMSLPMMISMLVQALYNVVDSMYVARISENALTAVSLAFPLQNIMIAIGSGSGVGMNAFLSRSLGSKNYEDADQAAATGILLSLVHYAISAVFLLSFAGVFMRSQTSVAEIYDAGTTYLRICGVLCIGLYFQMLFERLLQATGRTLHSMICQATGAIINIIFDPLLIFGIGPFPQLGVAGAAIATIFGQITAAAIGLFLNLKYNKDITLQLARVFRPKANIIRAVYAVGIPSTLMMSIGSVMTYLLNQILLTFSTTATAVFGVYFKLQSFFFMPVLGLNNGMVPIVAYNYGMRSKARIMEALKFAATLAIVFMCIGTLAFELFPEQLLGMFNASEEMLRIGVKAMRIIAVHFPIAGGCIILGSTFQAFGKGVYSLITSVTRQLVVLIPAAWLLAKTGNIDNVWLAFLIAEGASLLISLVMFSKIKREMIDTL